MTGLPLHLSSGQRATRAITCTRCACVCSDGSRGPGRLVQVWEGYRREIGPWLCAACSSSVWGAYLARVHERLSLIWASKLLGYPLTTTQYRAWCERKSVQLSFLEAA